MMFSRMYIACQSQEGDFDSFFKYENESSMAPLLDVNNSMRQGSKSDLMGCLEALAPRPEDTPKVEMKIIDGAAFMYTLDPTKSNVTVKTF